MTERKTYYLDTNEWIERLLVENGYPAGIPTHIMYDPEVNEDYDYQIIRGSAHDGTLVFTQHNVFETIVNLVNKTSYYKPAVEGLTEVKDVWYRIGDVKVDVEYRKVKGFPGQEETVSLPVKFYYERKAK